MTQNKKYKSIGFDEIVGAHAADYGQESAEGHSKHLWATQGRWSFKFVIVTKERRYDLHAASDDERKLWLMDFELILKDTKQQHKSRHEDA